MTGLSPLKKVLAWRLFHRRDVPSHVIDIIKWWELRRIPYNLAVGTTGILTLAVVLLVAGIASEKFGEPLGLPDPPIIAVFAVIGYGIGANVCFTGGWIAEILVRRLWPERIGIFGQASFFFGFVFSVVLTLVPAFLFSGLLVLRLLLR